MNVFTTLTDCHFTESDTCVVALGFFDGIHLAHRQVIQECATRAQARQGTSVVFTFQNHPTSLLSPHNAVRLLTPFPLKQKILQSLGIDALVAIPFDTAISSLPPMEFIETILTGLFKAKEIVVGYNFHFGRHREGTTTLLQSQIPHRFDRVTIIERLGFGKTPISSTLIRYKISQGDLQTAEQLLGRPYQITGKVIRGEGRGSQLGLPTANLDTKNQILPPNGVYGVMVRQGDLDAPAIPGVMNIGVVPTFHSIPKIQVEIHLLDFHGDLYDQILLADVVRFLRPEQKFASVDELVGQIHADIHMFQDSL
ncbi:MAG: bifunctional riboflavin kinase/FAD synthetase [bacterium]|jgi:riboflavin kinase/FMN adenylyltransferase|nr:bifunctional riboflavin kinase/FAD synthetase [bacterium]